MLSAHLSSLINISVDRVKINRITMLVAYLSVNSAALSVNDDLQILYRQ
jgi:hypothetical protein